MLGPAASRAFAFPAYRRGHGLRRGYWSAAARRQRADRDGGGFFAGTWVWTGRDWRKLHPAASPPARHNADLIYDAATQTVVMFGGYYLGDTWTWGRHDLELAHSAAGAGGRRALAEGYRLVRV